ncbi:unnamed protein product [Adineta steineri]|uniref:RING-type E3 ubiquitin transferase n=3 Tax=Adineta steineri TaxID=433720 RepID=A0A813T3W3_9BILA|nr:unnamed protein product [Adineta steineri]
MFDWNWLWVVGELGVSYGFYRWWKSNDTFVAVLEVAPDIDIDTLKKFSSSTSTIDLASVHGLVQVNDSKPNSVLKSQFISDSTGVIHRLTIREQRFEKARNVWVETKNLISDKTRYVPFRLVSPKGNFIRIDKPLEFNSVQDQLELIHVKFNPNVSSSVEKLINTAIGNVSKGIETQEHMLLIDIPLTGIGRLERRSGNWYLIPHEQWGGILSRSTRNEILSRYRKHSNIIRVVSILFGIAASCTAAYLIYRYYLKRQRQTNTLPRTAPVIHRNEDTNENTRLQCVICLDNETTYSLQPCSHLGLCHTCVEQLKNQTQQLCPICRTPIQFYQRIFLP